ncbi:hypothetical protein [Capnocytophaga cynodegmi]|nr:hypothetical protein [Capnocytophaga cynodegmi]
MQSFVHYNPVQEITATRLRRMFEQFYNTDVNAPFVEDEPLS